MLRQHGTGTGIARGLTRLAPLVLFGATALSACALAASSPAPAARTGSAATPTAPSVRVASRDLVLSLKHRIRPALQECFLAHEAKVPGQDLQASVTQTFAPNGRVRDLGLRPSLPAALAACLRTILSIWRLAAVPTPVRYGPFVVRFTPGR
jgi:hypothetical protein